MATYAQRAQAIADAIINSTATQNQINRIGEAVARINGQTDHYASLTNAQKAEFVVRHYRSSTIALVRTSDVELARSTASSSAETDLPEAP